MITVLIADDSADNRDILAEYLADEGYEIVVAANAHDTIRMAQAQLPDIILMDLQMPEAPDLRRLSDDAGLAATQVLRAYVINDKVRQLKQAQFAGNPAVAAVLHRFSSGANKRQWLLDWVGDVLAASTPGGRRAVVIGPELAAALPVSSNWVVLALAFHLELTTQAHYQYSTDDEHELSSLFREVSRDLWINESRHAIIDGIEWAREDAELDSAERDGALDELVELFRAIDRVLQEQAGYDAEFFLAANGHAFGHARQMRLRNALIAAYRWQNIEIGIGVARFSNTLGGFASGAQFERFQHAMSELLTPPPMH